MKKLIVEVIHARYEQRKRVQKSTYNRLLTHLALALFLSLEKTTFNFVRCLSGGYLLIYKCELSSCGFSGKQTAMEICVQVAHRGKRSNSSGQGRKWDWPREKGDDNESSAKPRGDTRLGLYCNSKESHILY